MSREVFDAFAFVVKVTAVFLRKAVVRTETQRRVAFTRER